MCRLPSPYDHYLRGKSPKYFFGKNQYFLKNSTSTKAITLFDMLVFFLVSWSLISALDRLHTINICRVNIEITESQFFIVFAKTSLLRICSPQTRTYSPQTPIHSIQNFYPVVRAQSSSSIKALYHKQMAGCHFTKWKSSTVQSFRSSRYPSKPTDS